MEMVLALRPNVRGEATNCSLLQFVASAEGLGRILNAPDGKHGREIDKQMGQGGCKVRSNQ